MKHLICLLSGVMLLAASLTNPGAEACCGPQVPMRCPVAGLGNDMQRDLCPGLGPTVYHHCQRKVTLKSPSLDYKGGKIYFCCANCIPVFQKSPQRFAASANWQLVVTYQAWQSRCPLCGGELKSFNEVYVAGVQVLVCSTDCSRKLARASAAERMQLVFGDPAFARGFKMPVKATPPKAAAAPAPKTAAATPATSAEVSGCCCCQ